MGTASVNLIDSSGVDIIVFQWYLIAEPQALSVGKHGHMKGASP